MTYNSVGVYPKLFVIPVNKNGSLKSNKTTSCGCYHKEVMQNIIIPKLISIMNTINIDFDNFLDNKKINYIKIYK